MAHQFAITLDNLHPDDRRPLGMTDSPNEEGRIANRRLREQAGYWVPPAGLFDKLTDRQKERLLAGYSVTWRG